MMNQYFFLKEQAGRLLILQHDYNEYINRLGVWMNDVPKSSDAESLEHGMPDEKKNDFLVVNRNADYLNLSLVEYLQEHNLAREHTLLRKTNKVSPIRKRSLQRFKRRASRMKKHVVHVPRQIEPDISFIIPIDEGSFWISSRFGPRRKENGAPGYHWGLDMAAVTGTIVKAAASGEVVEAGYAPGYGNTIVIKHTAKYRTRYAHLNSIHVKLGQYVDQGQKIGRVGSTGLVRSAGKDPSHLHFEVMESNRKINPFWVLPKIN